MLAAGWESNEERERRADDTRERGCDMVVVEVGEGREAGVAVRPGMVMVGEGASTPNFSRGGGDDRATEGNAWQCSCGAQEKSEEDADRTCIKAAPGAGRAS